MINIIVFYAVMAALCAAMLLAVAELMFQRNTAGGRFVRYFLIRLRELSMTKVVVTAILTLFWGLVVHDRDFDSLFAMLLMLLALLIVVHPSDFFTFPKRRKKAKTKKLSPLLTRTLAEAALTKDAAILTELLPVSGEGSDT